MLIDSINLKEQKQQNFLFLCTVLLSLFFHQTTRTGIGNNSISDIILLIILIFLMINKRLFLPNIFIIIFLLFLTFLLIVSVFYTPITFGIDIQTRSLIIDFIKLSILFAYSIIGYNLIKYDYIGILIKSYSFSALGIAILGILSNFFFIPKISELMHIYGLRLNGFMNDPNYFAILQVAALAYFIQTKQIKKTFQIIIILSIVLSIILSGSKTGLIITSSYFFMKAIESLIVFNRKISLKAINLRIITLSIIIIIFSIFLINFEFILNYIVKVFPVFQRIEILFNNFNLGISSDGSGREIAWKTGIELIQLSPVLGVGLGNYIGLSNKIFGINVIAHNTYIQLAAEWGMPVAVMFFSLLLLLIINITIKYKNDLSLIIQRDIIIIFLLASFALSLNNARFFWLILGSIICLYLKQEKNRKNKRDQLSQDRSNKLV